MHQRDCCTICYVARRINKFRKTCTGNMIGYNLHVLILQKKKTKVLLNFKMHEKSLKYFIQNKHKGKTILNT